MIKLYEFDSQTQRLASHITALGRAISAHPQYGLSVATLGGGIVGSVGIEPHIQVKVPGMGADPTFQRNVFDRIAKLLEALEPEVKKILIEETAKRRAEIVEAEKDQAKRAAKAANAPAPRFDQAALKKAAAK